MRYNTISGPGGYPGGGAGGGYGARSASVSRAGRSAGAGPGAGRTPGFGGYRERTKSAPPLRRHRSRSEERRRSSPWRERRVMTSFSLHPPERGEAGVRPVTPGRTKYDVDRQSKYYSRRAQVEDMKTSYMMIYSISMNVIFAEFYRQALPAHLTRGDPAPSLQLCSKNFLSAFLLRILHIVYPRNGLSAAESSRFLLLKY